MQQGQIRLTLAFCDECGDQAVDETGKGARKTPD